MKRILLLTLSLTGLFLSINFSGCKSTEKIAEPRIPQTIKVLTVGNSFANNSLTYLEDMAHEAGIEVIVFRANLGGASLDRHANHLLKHLENPDDPEGSPYYAGKDETTGEVQYCSLVEALQMEEWDYITIQQVSWKSFRWDTFEPHAGKIIEAIRKNAPTARIMVHEIWAYREDHPWFIEGEEGKPKSQKEMYSGLQRSYYRLAENYDLGLLPVGDAWQIARSMPEWHYQYPDPDYDFTHPSPDTLPDQKGSLNAGYFWKLNEDTGVKELKMDANHAGVAGKFLGGCIFLESFAGHEAIRDAQWHPDELSDGQAASLREIAHQAIEKLPENRSKVLAQSTRN